MTLESHRENSTIHVNEARNPNYKSDVNHSIQYTSWLLMLLGIWPMVKRNCNKPEYYVSKLLVILCSVLMAFIMIPCTLHMIFVEKDTLVRLMLMGPVGFCLTNILKYVSMIYRAKGIKLCIDHVETDWMMIETAKDRKIMRKNVNIGRNLTSMCGLFMYTGGFAYHTIMPLWQGRTINEYNETIRPLAYPGYDLFVDSQLTPTYEFIFYTNCLSAVVTSTVTTVACNLAATFVTHTCGQIDIMMYRLETLFDSVESKTDILKHRVNVVIQCHVRILRFTSRVEEILRDICLVEVVASTLTICLLEYYCMTEWNNSEMISMITYFVLLVSLTFNIFIFCHIGELLKGKSYQVGEATYMIDWYKMPGKTGMALVMIIAMANYPRKITAGRMMELSITSFGAIIKTSVMYLNMLRTVAVS